MTAITKKYHKVDKIIPHQFEIDWQYAILLTMFHVIAVYGLYLHLMKPIGGWNEFCLNVYLVIANLFCMFGIVAGLYLASSILLAYRDNIFKNQHCEEPGE